MERPVLSTMTWSGSPGYPCIQERFQRLTSAGDCRVVWCRELDIHDVKNRMDEAFSLAEREVKEETQGQDGLDCDV